MGLAPDLKKNGRDYPGHLITLFKYIQTGRLLYVYRPFNHYDKLVANATALYFIYFLNFWDKQKNGREYPSHSLIIYSN
jgi:hypothetical protein